jgi:hypothetical protein
MSAKSRAAHHRRLVANAITTAMRMTSEVDRETLLLIAREHLRRAEKASRPPPGRGRLKGLRAT